MNSSLRARPLEPRDVTVADLARESPRLPLRVKVSCSWVHQRTRCALRNSDPLSESIPSSGNGKRSRTCSKAPNTAACPLPQTPAHSVQPVATSVTVRVFR